jgi:hypothetical protein
VASNATASSVASANVKLVKPVAGSLQVSSSVAADAKVRYVVAANASVVFSVTAQLKKTANLADLEGTAAITNVIKADVHLRKNLGGNVVSLASFVAAKVFVAHSINLDDSDIGDRTFTDVSGGSVSADAISQNVFAEVTDVYYITAEESIQSWPLAA